MARSGRIRFMRASYARAYHPTVTIEITETGSFGRRVSIRGVRTSRARGHPWGELQSREAWTSVAIRVRVLPADELLRPEIRALDSAALTIAGPPIASISRTSNAPP